MKKIHIILTFLTAIFMLLSSVAVYSVPDSYGWTSCEDTDGGNTPGTYGAIRLINATAMVVANDFCYRQSTGVQAPVTECSGDDCMILEYVCWDTAIGAVSSTSTSATGANNIWGPYVHMATRAGFTGCRIGAGTTAAAPTCSDGIKNGEESGVDCGGTCNACPAAVTPTCTDGIKNGEETGVDCGGRCGTYCRESPPLTGRGACVLFCDRYSAQDTAYFTECRAICDREFPTATPTGPSCTDGIKNNAETDIDCGGNCGTACVVGKACIRNDDCVTMNCVTNICKEKALAIAKGILTLPEVRARDILISTEPRLAVANAEEPEAEVAILDEEPRVGVAEGVPQDYADEAVIEEETDSPGIFRRSWNRIMGVFRGNNVPVSHSPSGINSEAAFDLGLEFGNDACEQETISGEDFCGTRDSLRNSIAAVWDRLKQRLDTDVEPRLEDLEEVSGDLMNGGIEQRVTNKFKSCRRYTVESPQQQQTTCQNFCETQNKMCLNGFVKYNYLGHGSIPGECETSLLGFTFCGAPTDITVRVPFHEHMDCVERFAGTIDSMVCFCCS